MTKRFKKDYYREYTDNMGRQNDKKKYVLPEDFWIDQRNKLIVSGLVLTLFAIVLLIIWELL